MGTIMGAVTGAVKNWSLARFPSLHHRKEGCLRHQENFAKPPKLTQTGWFSCCSHRKTTPSSLLRLRDCAPRRSADASRYFLNRSATPPCSDARRGIALDSNFFTASPSAPASPGDEIRLYCDLTLLLSWTKATRFRPLQAITRLPSGVAIMLRTTPPPDGITQVWNFSVLGSKRTSVFGLTPDSLYQTTPLI